MSRFLLVLSLCGSLQSAMPAAARSIDGGYLLSPATRSDWLRSERPPPTVPQDPEWVDDTLSVASCAGAGVEQQPRIG